MCCLSWLFPHCARDTSRRPNGGCSISDHIPVMSTEASPLPLWLLPLPTAQESISQGHTQQFFLLVFTALTSSPCLLTSLANILLLSGLGVPSSGLMQTPNLIYSSLDNNNGRTCESSGEVNLCCYEPQLETWRQLMTAA